MASFLRASPKVPTSSSRTSPPPTSFRPADAVPTSFSSSHPPPAISSVGVGRRPRDANLSVQDERERQANRTSRVDVDFESALAGQETFKLQEGPDISAFGREKELESPTASRDTHELTSTPSRPRASSFANPTPPVAIDREPKRPSTANSTTPSGRRLRKPHHSTSPSRSPPVQSANPLGHLLHRSPTNSPRPSASEYSSVTSSPAPSHQDLPDEDNAAGRLQCSVRPQSSGRNARGERAEEVKKRSMFRSTATASSPDLGTIVRKKKSNIPKVPSKPNTRHHEHDDDDQVYASTDVQPSNLSNWTSTLGGRSRASSRGDDAKSSKTLRARTGTFLSKVFSTSGTVRDRSRSGTGSALDASAPNTPHRTAFAHTFDSPPVPSIPPEFRADSLASQNNTPTKSSKRASKPLPPIVYSPTSEKSHGEMIVSPIGSSESSSNKGGNGRRRRSMSVSDAERWHKGLSVSPSSTPSKQPTSSSTSRQATDSTPERLDIPSPTRPAGQRSVSSTSNASSTATATPSKIITSPKEASSASASSLASKEWESALIGWDSEKLASLEIKDPSITIRPPGRPRARTQDPMPIPPRLSLGLKGDGSDVSPLRTGSMGSPPAGFHLNDSALSLYSTPPTGLTPTSPSSGFASGTSSKRNSDITIQRHQHESDTVAKRSFDSVPSPARHNSDLVTRPTRATPVRHNSETATSTTMVKRSSDNTIPFTGPVIIGTTPVSIGHTVTTVKIDRSGSPATGGSGSPNLGSPTTPTPTSSTSMSSPSTSPNGIPNSGQRRSSSSNGSNSPQLPPNSPISPRAAAAAASPRVSSLRGMPRPTLSTATGSSRSLRPPDNLSPKISVSLTSPSQENLRPSHGALNRGLGGGGMKYSLRNPASASEPALGFPVGYGGVGEDEVIKTIRLITSGSRLRSERGDSGDTAMSSPANSAKHGFFSNTSAGTSVGRSSVSRDGSIGTTASSGSYKEVGSGVGLSQEELETKADVIAQRIWEEDETFRSREKFSEWLGGTDPLNTVTRRFYMDRFDFTGMRIDNAFRRLCAKLYLRGESQIIDRILVEFSRRYWEHNPTSVLGNASNVHQVVYSLLLLNTDLHIADLAYHMTRQQFLNNTMSTLIAPSRTSSSAPTPARSSSPVQSLRQDTELSRKSSIDPLNNNNNIGTSTSLDKSGPPISIQNTNLRVKRSGSVTSWKGSLSREASRDPLGAPSGHVNQASPSGTVTENSSLNGSTVSVHDPMGRKHSIGNGSVSSLPIAGQKAWEADMESYLKDIYNAIRNNQILQPTGTGGLSPGQSLGRRGSQRHVGPSISNMKRGSIRLGSLVPSQQTVNGSSSSIDGRMSPSPSFSTSNDGMTASSSTLFTPPALGFVSNLAHTIIGESQEDDLRSVHSDGSDSTDVSMGDEELALLGAPWAKEGMLTRKHYWESTGKRSKNKSWMNVFVVIQKGQLNMFTFGGTPGGSGMSSTRAMGGGNWLSNATNVGEHMLAHSLAHILPPPGLPRRPHCFVLTLSNGISYFFQTGTEELANEWVSTCNYWAARQSKEPLAGGVSNMEHGWSRVEPEALAADSQSDTDGPLDLPPRAMSAMDNSDNFSLMSGKSKMAGRFDGFSTLRSSPFMDRIYINDWRAPGHSMIASTHDEETQLEALQRQAETLKADLKKHNDLREPMIGLYTPRSSNLAKAMINWESRSQYLLTEIVKYEKYIESLRSAMKERLRRRGEKALEKALLSSNLGNNSRGFGFADEETIHEGQETDTEPPTPAAKQVQFQHKRDATEVTS